VARLAEDVVDGGSCIRSGYQYFNERLVSVVICCSFGCWQQVHPRDAVIIKHMSAVQAARRL